MKSIEMMVTITKERRLIIPMPKTISYGKHKVIIVIDEPQRNKRDKNLLDFPVDHYGDWPKNLSLSRGEIYGRR